MTTISPTFLGLYDSLKHSIYLFYQRNTHYLILIMIIKIMIMIIIITIIIIIIIIIMIIMIIKISSI